MVTAKPYVIAEEDIARTKERWWAKVEKQENGCWLWTGSTTKFGYGWFQIKTEGKWTAKLAHRVGWYLFKGTHTNELDHLCRVRACVNPDHLEPVTHMENMNRSPLVFKGDTCDRGHTDQWYYPPNGKRRCKGCITLMGRAYKEKMDPETRRQRQREATARWRAKKKKAMA